MSAFLSSDKLRSLIFPFDRVIGEIPGRSRVLDIGSGYGTFAVLISKKKRNVSVTGVEIDAKKVGISKKKTGNFRKVKILKCDFRKFKTKEKFDVITCLDVLHHMPRDIQNSVMNKAHDLLKPGGIFILVDIRKKPRIKYLWNYLHDIMISRSRRFNYVPMENAKGMIKSCGFSISSVKDASLLMYGRYMIIGRK